MAKAKINENGDLVNSETGELIGNVRKGPINFDSQGAEMHTLEDYGVLLPEFPDEEEGENKSESNKQGEWVSANVDESSSSSSKPSDGSDVSEKTHVDNGPSSFKRQRTKYEVSDDSYFVIRFGLIQKEDGRFIPITGDSAEDMIGAELHWVKFRMWKYDEELKWKSECMEYNSQMKAQAVNMDKLNERKIRMLMLDWSFGTCDDRLKLLHCDGKLSDESYSIFRGMYPSIANTIVNMMNLVLESNQ